jgi:hypothetical protein
MSLVNLQLKILPLNILEIIWMLCIPHEKHDLKLLYSLIYLTFKFQEQTLNRVSFATRLLCIRKLQALRSETPKYLYFTGRLK